MSEVKVYFRTHDGSRYRWWTQQQADYGPDVFDVISKAEFRKRRKEAEAQGITVVDQDFEDLEEG